MNVQKIANLNIRPTDRKMRKAKEFVDSIVPKGKSVKIKSQMYSFTKIKNSINVFIEKMIRG